MCSRFVGVAGWLKNSFIDFPGTVSTVLFYSGCNLRCPYCHNPGLLLNSDSEDFKRGSDRMPDGGMRDPSLAPARPAERADLPLPPLRGENPPQRPPDEIPLDIADASMNCSILNFLESRKHLMEGVVFSGGEPTLHSTLEEDVEMVRRIGYKIKLDTNGLLPGMVQQINPDYLAVDIKTIPSLYPVLLASPYGDVERRLRDTLKIVKAMGKNAEVRITVAPGIVDRSIIMQIGELVQGVARLFLQPMQQRVPLLDPAYSTRELIPANEIADYRDILSEYVAQCGIRGA